MRKANSVTSLKQVLIASKTMQVKAQIKINSCLTIKTIHSNSNLSLGKITINSLVNKHLF